MAKIDLDDVNYALQELSRLQIAGEIAADEAWQERQKLLDAVEANWDDVPEQVMIDGAEPVAAQVNNQEAHIEADTKSSASQKVWFLLSRQVWPRLQQLGLVWALLGLTVATWLYVASL